MNPNGFKTVQPLANATYRLRARLIGVGEAEIATLPVGVVLPPDSSSPGRQLVTITANNQAPLLVQALGTPNTTVVVSNDVQLDLSYRHDIAVAEGVILRGGRSKLLPGPRLFTTPGSPCSSVLSATMSASRAYGSKVLTWAPTSATARAPSRWSPSRGSASTTTRFRAGHWPD